MQNRRIVAAAAFVALAGSVYLISESFSDQNVEATACDALAAHPSDPRKKGAGVALGKLPFESAIEECGKSAKQHPKVARFKYQLGRAFEAGKDLYKANSMYREASALDYPMADFNIAIGYHNERKYDQALEGFKKALAGGVSAAKTEIDNYSFSGDLFSAKGVLSEIVVNKKPTFDFSGAAYYAYEFASLFNNTCKNIGIGAAVYDLERLAKRKMMGDMLRGFAAGEGRHGYGSREAALENGLTVGAVVSASIQQQAAFAKRDAQTFYDRYQCRGPVSDAFFSNLREWVRTL